MKLTVLERICMGIARGATEQLMQDHKSNYITTIHYNSALLMILTCGGTAL